MNLAQTAQLAYQWIDLLWVPVAYLTMERGKRFFTCLFALSCTLLLRLQVELLQQMHYPRGIVGLMKSDVFTRGLVAYAAAIALFLVLAYYSKGGDKNVHIAASITILIGIFCLSSVIMVL